jgi:hypothetical protein
MLSVQHNNAVVFGKGRQLRRAPQPSSQYHLLELPQCLLEYSAPAPVTLSLDQIGLDANRRDHPAVARPDRIGFLDDGGRYRWRRLFSDLPADLHQTSTALGQGANYGWLVAKSHLSLHQRSAVNRQDRMRTGLGYHDSPVCGAWAVHQHIGSAQIGQDTQVAFYLLQKDNVLLCQAFTFMNHTVHLFLNSEKTPTRSSPR